MITNRGKEVILRYLAQLETQIGSALELGVGVDPFSLEDTSLSFLAYSVNVEIIGVDLANSTVVFKATVPESYSGTFTEMGLSYSVIEAGAGKYESAVLASGNPASEGWNGGAFTTANVNYNNYGVLLSPSAGSDVARMDNFTYDFSGYSNLDKFKMLCFVVSSISGAKVRLHNNATDYFEFSTSVVAGKQIIEFSKSDFVPVGSPDWSTIEYMEIEASSATTGSFTFDALRIDDKDSVNEDNFLISRVVLAEPFVKVQGEPLEIEYGMEITI